MYNMKIKMKFIQLKAEGIPTYMIAKELGVHRTTLTLWQKELAAYILIARQDFIDELLYENNMTKIGRIECITNNLSSLYDSLSGRNSPTYSLPYEETVNAILKFTKLLHLEQGEKHIEKILKENTKEISKEKSESENEKTHSVKDEAPIWITDMKAFRIVQPEGETEAVNEDLSNGGIVKEEIDSDSFITNYETLRDISKDDPKVQKIFNKTKMRTRRKELEEKEIKQKEIKKENDKKNDKEIEKETEKESVN